MGEPDSLIEVLKEIRDEIRALRTELGDRGARMAASGIRTEVVERGARWRIAATAGAGAMALVALLLKGQGDLEGALHDCRAALEVFQRFAEEVGWKLGV